MSYIFIFIIDIYIYIVVFSSNPEIFTNMNNRNDEDEQFDPKQNPQIQHFDPRQKFRPIGKSLHF